MSHEATIVEADGYLLVERTDDVIWVSADLWRQIVEDEPDVEHGRAVIDINAGTLIFGTPGRGLGRLTYRFVEHRPDAGVYVYERVQE